MPDDRPPGQSAPPQIEPQSLSDYLEVMSKAVFQSGISWRVVEAKWPGTREAFRDFDAEAVANLSPDDVDALASDQRIIRNRRKIEGIVYNARTMLELDAQPGGFKGFLRSHGSFDATTAALRKHFKFMGEMGCYYFLYVVGEKVPPHEVWVAARGRSR
jgi:3-methyladenine DNA glycosylase Tag